MEKEKLSATLTGMVGENSLSTRTWNDYLDNSVLPFFPSEEEKVNDFLTKHANALKSINGQLNNEVATRVNEFKKNYTPETITVNSQQSTVDNPDKTVQHADDKKLTDLEARLSKFEQAEAEKKVAVQRKLTLDEVKTLMKEQGATHDTVITLILPQLEITQGSTASDLAKKGKELYDKAYSDLYGDSYVPASNGGYSSGNRKNDKDAYMRHLKETGRINN